jgi:hypothetical protein
MVFKSSILKNAIILLCLIVASNNMFGQGNLQFNQVLTYAGQVGTWDSTYTTYSTVSPTFTVPTGKLWKIETKTISTEIIHFYVNNVFFKDYVAVYGGYGTAYAYSYNISNPIWLKAGDSVYFKAEGSGTPSGPYFISIIEYNITP